MSKEAIEVTLARIDERQEAMAANIEKLASAESVTSLGNRVDNLEANQRTFVLSSVSMLVTSVVALLGSLFGLLKYKGFV